VQPNLVSRRKVLIGGALGLTAVLSELYVPTKSSPELSEKTFEALFPNRIHAWSYLSSSGLVLPPADQLSRALYERLITRVYATGESANAQVMMLVAYSSVQEGRLQLHRPEVCYPAAGFTINSNEPKSVVIAPSLSIPARYIVAEQGGKRECILYWTRVGPEMPQSWAQQRLMMARANLEGYIPDGLLGRVSIISNDPSEAFLILSSFIRELVDTMNLSGRQLLLGSRFIKQLSNGV
jgi:EpsI family protein